MRKPEMTKKTATPKEPSVKIENSDLEPRKWSRIFAWHMMTKKMLSARNPFKLGINDFTKDSIQI